MSGTDVPSIGELYEQDPSLYDAVTARDFEKQASVVLRFARAKAPRVLELFAGPARHARALKALGARVTCVDASLGMRRLALAAGLAPEEYIRARLPALPVRGPFDAVLLLQFSAGILDPASLEVLLRRLAPRLRRGAPVLVELRRLSVLRACEKPLGVMPRTVPWTDGREVRFVCPDDGFDWGEGHRTVAMTVRVDVLVSGEVRETRRWCLEERLVAPADLRRFAARSGLYRFEKVQAAAFPQTALVVLRKV